MKFKMWYTSFVMQLKDFYYDLPKELIAQDPLKDRSSSRLMVLNRGMGEVKHDIFKNIPEYLNPGDCLVINDTKVIPARLLGTKNNSPVEVLLLERKSADIWECIVRPGKKLRKGAEVVFGGTAPEEEKVVPGDATHDDEKDVFENAVPQEHETDVKSSASPLLAGEIIDVLPDGNRLIKFTFTGIFEEILDKLGKMPLPPYITHELKDKDRYQTVYAAKDGSAAAPTAGLHFTPELLKEIENKGVKIAKITLHVGLGTFRPVREENILDHHMHSEYYEVSEQAAEIINKARQSGGRIICVGTTSVRTLESVADESGIIKPGCGRTEIFIYPGYKFKATDALITNFHLPESTLLMLVAAFSSRENILNAYKEAIKERYRFFSFGDAMLIK